MEPLNDWELDRLLNLWAVSDTPQDLEEILFSRRIRWWERLFSRHWLVIRAGRRKRLRKV
jgi:hypothetical protein